MSRMMNGRRDADVVIVGAGMSGIVAARELVAADIAAFGAP